MNEAERYIRKSFPNIKILRGRECKIECPQCGNDEACSINIENGLWNCLRSSCACTGNLDKLKMLRGDMIDIERDIYRKPQKDDAQNVQSVMSLAELTAQAKKLRTLEQYDKARGYLLSRGLTMDVIEHFNLGAVKEIKALGPHGQKTDSGYILIPFLENGELKAIKSRAVPPEPEVSGKKSRYAKVQGSLRPFIAHSNVASRTVVVCSGEIDAISLYQIFYNEKRVEECPNVISVPAGEGKWNDAWSALIKNFDEVVVIFDNDRAGEIGADKVAKAIGQHKTKIGKLPDGLKDISKALEKNAITVNSFFDIISKSSVVAARFIGSATDTLSALVSSYRNPQTGDSTGFKSIDRLAGGIRRGELTVITAPTGIGKSTFASSIMMNMSMRFPTDKFLIIPSEMGSQKQLERMIWSIIGQDPSLVGTDKLEKAVSKLENIWMFSKIGQIELEKFRSSIMYMIEVVGVRLILIDTMNHVVMEERGENRYDAMDNYVFALDELVKETNSSIFAIAHPRKTEGEGKHRDSSIVQASDIAGKMTLVQQAANVWSLYRLIQNDRTSISWQIPGTDQKVTVATLVVLKNRDPRGSTGNCHILYNDSNKKYIDPEDVGITIRGKKLYKSGVEIPPIETGKRFSGDTDVDLPDFML